MSINYFRPPINDSFEEECKKLKEELEKRYKNVTWAELFAVIFEKNRRIKLSSDEMDNIMKRMRGFS